MKLSFDLKIEILSKRFGWHLLVVDQNELMAFPNSQVKEHYIRHKLEPLKKAFKPSSAQSHGNPSRSRKVTRKRVSTGVL